MEKRLEGRDDAHGRRGASSSTPPAPPPRLTRDAQRSEATRAKGGEGEGEELGGRGDSRRPRGGQGGEQRKRNLDQSGGGGQGGGESGRCPMGGEVIVGPAHGPTSGAWGTSVHPTFDRPTRPTPVGAGGPPVAHGPAPVPSRAPPAPA